MSASRRLSLLMGDEESFVEKVVPKPPPDPVPTTDRLVEMRRRAPGRPRAVRPYSIVFDDLMADEQEARELERRSIQNAQALQESDPQSRLSAMRERANPRRPRRPERPPSAPRRPTGMDDIDLSSGNPIDSYFETVVDGVPPDVVEGLFNDER